MAGQRRMTVQKCLLTGHFFTSPVILTGLATFSSCLPMWLLTSWIKTWNYEVSKQVSNSLFHCWCKHINGRSKTDFDRAKSWPVILTGDPISCFILSSPCRYSFVKFHSWLIAFLMDWNNGLEQWWQWGGEEPSLLMNVSFMNKILPSI